MPTSASPVPSTNGRAATQLRLIDCDVHHTLPNDKALFPYLPRHYVERIEDFGSMMPQLGHTNMPKHGNRQELWRNKRPIQRPMSKWRVRGISTSTTLTWPY